MTREKALWPLGDPDAGPAAGEVHVWFVDLSDPPVDDALGALLLSEAERERAARFRMRPLRRRYVVGRAALRTLLGLATNRSPDELSIVEGEDGKPHLDSDASVRFNVAHSDDLLLIAISRAGDVGVDVEQIREMPELDGLVRRVLTDREREVLNGQALCDRTRLFFRAWTRKEAVLKSTGHGLRIATSSIEVTLDDPICCTWRHVGPDAGPSGVPGSLRGMLPVARCEAALVCAREAVVRCRAWIPPTAA